MSVGGFGERIKVAVIREAGHPIGQPAPCYLNCPCGARPPNRHGRDHPGRREVLVRARLHRLGVARMLTCESCNQEHRPSERGLSVDECALLQHVMLWGSHGYPIHRLTRGGGRISQGRGHTMGWTWDYRTIKGPPTVFKTKRAAVESVERFLDILRDAKAGRI